MNNSMICPSGKKVSVNESCHGQCPISLRSNLAINVKNSPISKDSHCPSGIRFSKPMDFKNKSIEGYCGKGGVACPKPTYEGSWQIDQCFSG